MYVVDLVVNLEGQLIEKRGNFTSETGAENDKRRADGFLDYSELLDV